MSQQTENDEDLVSRVANGDQRAFATLVQRHSQRFLNLAFRTLQHQGDAEDVLQTAFIKLWQNPSAWDSNKSQFTTWFYRVVINACHDYTRQHQRQFSNQKRLFDEVSRQMQVDSEQLRLEKQQTEVWQTYCLESAIQQLPESQRDALNLAVYCAVPQKQVAEVLGVTVKAVEGLLSRAKKNIANTVAQLEQSELVAQEDL